MTLLLGMQLYASSSDANRRQENAIKAAMGLSNVKLVNLQFSDGHDLFTHEGFETLRVLEAGSHTLVTGPGSRKPVVREIFDRLAEQAEKLHCRYFAFANSDVLVSQSAVELIVSQGKESYSFSRMDFDGKTGNDTEILKEGVDFIAVDVNWWKKNSWRFRPYLLGVWYWDNAYAPMLLRHSDGILLNHQTLIRHELHPTSSKTHQAVELNLNFLIRDGIYFHLWVSYIEKLTALRKKAASLEEELELQEKVFRSPISPVDHVKQGLRSAKWGFLYRLSKLRGAKAKGDKP